MKIFVVAISVILGCWHTAQMADAAEFFVLPGTKSLLVMGETIPGDFEEFQRFVSEEQVDTVILRGPGGALEVAFAIANDIQARGLNTVVAAKSECASACSLMFISGKKRTMEESSKLGFHLPFLALTGDATSDYCEAIMPIPAGQDPSIDALNLAIRRANPKFVSSGCLRETYRLGFSHLSLFSKIMRKSEVSNEVFDVMIETPPDSMFWYGPDEARSLNLVN